MLWQWGLICWSILISFYVDLNAFDVDFKWILWWFYFDFMLIYADFMLIYFAFCKFYIDFMLIHVPHQPCCGSGASYNDFMLILHPSYLDCMLMLYWFHVIMLIVCWFVLIFCYLILFYIHFMFVQFDLCWFCVDLEWFHEKCMLKLYWSNVNFMLTYLTLCRYWFHVDLCSYLSCLIFLLYLCNSIYVHFMLIYNDWM